MPLAAPARMRVTEAPQVFSDPDIAFNDMTEQLWVNNESKREVRWAYGKREWVLKPKAKPVAIPLQVCIKYLGDPRSAHGVTNQFTIPGEQRPGVVPERYSELRRLSILYGVYEGLLPKLATVKFGDIPRDRNDPQRDLFPEEDKHDTVVPKITVTTLDGREVKFPIYEPEASPYRYDTEVTGMTDVRTELEKLQRQQAMLLDRIDSLKEASDDGDVPPALEDSVTTPGL